MDSINNKLEENKRPSVMQTLNQCQVERSAVYGIPTWRNLSTSAKCNQNVCKQYTSEVEDTTELGTCFGEDDKLGTYNPTELLHKLCEVMIRFDANPKFYLKSDYQKLIELIKEILSSIIYIINNHNQVTEKEVLEILINNNIINVITNKNNDPLTDKNNNILTL